MWGADTPEKPNISQGPNIWCRVRHSPIPHLVQIFDPRCPIHKCFKIVTVLRFYSIFPHYILNLDKFFCLFLHVAMLFIKG